MTTTYIENPKDAVCQQELEHIARCDLDWSAFSHKTVLVTGATGLVGSYAVRTLAAANRIHGCGMTILAMVRSADKAQKIYGSLLERGDVALLLGDVRDPIVYDGPVDYIIHGASVTASKEMVTRPVETIATAIGGTEQILKFAVAKQVTSMVYISSMEMYGTPDPNLSCVTESDYGRVDVLQVRSCYPEGKRMCECLCAAYAHEYHLPVKIARAGTDLRRWGEHQRRACVRPVRPEPDERRGHRAPHRGQVLWQLLRHLRLCAGAADHPPAGRQRRGVQRGQREDQHPHPGHGADDRRPERRQDPRCASTSRRTPCNTATPLM